MPDFILGTHLYDTLTWFQDNFPDIFYPERQMFSVFGAWPGMVWGGGSAFIQDVIPSSEQMDEQISIYNEKFRMMFVYTFTNPLLEEKHIYDTYCNKACEILNNHPGNAILVVSPILEEHIRQNYPNIKIHKSIISTENQDYDPSDKYDMTVLKRIRNADNEFLRNIPDNIKKKLEILCTDPCPDDCPLIYEHYRKFAKSTINFTLHSEHKCVMGDKMMDPFVLYYREHYLKTYVSPSRVDDLSNMGFSYFKLSGRGDLCSMVENAIMYLIKPEYQADVRRIVYFKYLQRK